MSGNAHRSRHRRRGAKPCSPTCLYCKYRPKEARAIGGLYRNKTGHRHNPARKRRQKRPNKK